MVQIRCHYKICLEHIVLDYAEGSKTIRWAPAIARLLGQETTRLEGLRA